MFETAVREERDGKRWRIISACVALVVLLAIGYMLIA
jgi:hypothetical protein